MNRPARCKDVPLTQSDGMRAAPESCIIYGEGDDLYAAMLEDIGQARDTIQLESYIFAGDEIGWRFVKTLVERANAGVHVRVHMDAAGALFEGTDKLYWRLRKAGVHVRWFNRWRWRDPWHYNRRNHRKLLVVDDRSIYVGGFNVHRASSRMQVGIRRWRDVHVRLAGRLSAPASALFDELWDRRRAQSPPPWDGSYRLVPNATRACRHVLYCEYMAAVAAAEVSITIASPYFVPNRRFRAALVAAVRRSVDVRVLLPAESDQRFVRWASHALARPLARRGVQFFEYLPRMLHSKVTLVDASWAIVGSANVDYRSFFINQELNLVSRDPVVCQQLDALLREDFSQARPLSISSQRGSRLGTLRESLAHRLRHWL